MLIVLRISGTSNQSRIWPLLLIVLCQVLWRRPPMGIVGTPHKTLPTSRGHLLRTLSHRVGGGSVVGRRNSRVPAWVRGRVAGRANSFAIRLAFIHRVRAAHLVGDRMALPDILGRAFLLRCRMAHTLRHEVAVGRPRLAPLHIAIRRIAMSGTRLRRGRGHGERHLQRAVPRRR